MPNTGITIIASQFRTRARGIRVVTRHFRGVNELREIGRDDYHSHNFQEIRLLKFKSHVAAGDALVATCSYDTTSDSNVTMLGDSKDDDLCENYLYYYPAMELEVCKSAVSNRTLEDYFTYMKK